MTGTNRRSKSHQSYPEASRSVLGAALLRLEAAAMLRMGLSRDTSCMKAHVVKGLVLAVVFLLAARFREAVAGTAGWAIVFSLLLPVAFVFRPGAARNVLSS